MNFSSLEKTLLKSQRVFSDSCALLIIIFINYVLLQLYLCTLQSIGLPPGTRILQKAEMQRRIN